jgi:hypothetical protein
MSDLNAVESKRVQPRAARGKAVAPKFKTRYLTQVKLACEMGFTDYQLRGLLGVSAEVLDCWRLSYPEFDAAIKVGRAPADDCVKRSLFERAVGYYVDAEKIFIDREGNVVRVSTKEYVPPSDKAQEFWLTNRLPDEWRSRQEVKHSGGVRQPQRYRGGPPALTFLFCVGGVVVTWARGFVEIS